MAGGQGTRLGHSGPKGTYCLNTIHGPKYLFEIMVDTFKRAEKEYHVVLPWYIMTSKENHKETIRFLEEKEYFGYDKSKVKFFMQGELPLLSTEGKLILGKDKKIKEAANGNGGIYEAIEANGILKELKEQNIEWIFINSMDNVLCNFVDPLLIGLTIEQNHKIASKSVAKVEPKERAGVFCKMNGKPKVIEYTELPDEMAEERDENGELAYGELHIMLNLFHRSILEDLANVKLPYHIAFKKSGYLDKKGEYIEPEEPNIYKFEAFIFDAFTRYNDMTILRVKREEEFAPVKNRTGVDSPETATALYNARYE
ncbi:MAG: UDPGP type 1 family protein [Clostridia bacterium]|nr:UDPGP type 1 family protein [Clostridia bacterium]